MSILPRIYKLKDEAQDQLYEWFDKEVRSLPKDKSGKNDPMADGLVDNDVDAMRHAFVSGVYALEYSEQTAEMMGRYPGYAIKKNESGEFPYSTRDRYSFNNLG
jgi:hypothetical protein